VAGDADPATGYRVRVDGTDAVYGGTSAVAPLWAALVCRLAEALGRSPGFLPPVLYGGVTAGRTAPGFRDITSGSNGAYTAQPGWDACTGLGVPDGEALLARLRL
jgi:kumamolisin